MIALEKDRELSTARFELVPKKIAEKEFWKNYFTRVYMIKQAYKIPMSSPPVVETAAAGTCPVETDPHKAYILIILPGSGSETA